MENNNEEKLIEDFIKKIKPKGKVDHKNHLTVLNEEPPEDMDFWNNLYKEEHPDAKI